MELCWRRKTMMTTTNKIEVGDVVNVCGGKYKGHMAVVAKITAKMVTVKLSQMMDSVRILQSNIEVLQKNPGLEGARYQGGSREFTIIQMLQDEIKMMQTRMDELSLVLEALSIKRERR